MGLKQFLYSGNERLKSTKVIELLFKEGKSINAYPLKLIYIETPFNDNIHIKTSVSVSKRLFKKAVDRNRLKRLMREAYRLNKRGLFNKVTTQYAFMFLYIGSKQEDFETINDAMIHLLKKFCNKENKNMQ